MIPWVIDLARTRLRILSGVLLLAVISGAGFAEGAAGPSDDAVESRLSEPSLGPMGGYTSDVKLAERASDTVAVWYSASRVWASVIDAAGVPSLAIPIGSTVDNRVPGVHALGPEAMVYWSDRGTLFRRRLTESGGTPDAPQQIATGVDHVRVARSGGTTGVLCDAYVVGGTFTGSVLHLLDEDGRVTRRELVWPDAGAPLAAWNGGFVTGGATNDGLFLRRLTGDGRIVDAVPIRVEGPGWGWDLAAWGDRAWAVMRDRDYPSMLRVAAISPEGRIVATRTVTVPPSADGRYGYVQLGAGADGLAILVEMDDDVYRVEIANDGSLRQPLARVAGGAGRQWGRAVSLGAGALELYSDDSRTDVFVQRSGSHESRYITVGGTRVTSHAVAAGADSMLAVWREDAGNAQVYRYRLLDASGRPLAPPVEFDRGNGVNFHATVAWSGREFGIFWEANGRTSLLRVGGDGVVRGERITLASVPYYARMFGGHDRFVMIGTANEYDAAPLVASVVDENGASAPIAVTAPPPPPEYAWTWDHDPWLVPDAGGWLLGHSNTILYGCVGVPCPEETSAWVARLTVELTPVSAGLKLAADASVAGAASNDGVAAVLVHGDELRLYTMPAGKPPVATTLRTRYSWYPQLGAVDLAPHPGGFALAIAESTPSDSWCSVSTLDLSGGVTGVRVAAVPWMGVPRLARSASDSVVLYARAVEGEHGGTSVFTRGWLDSPEGPSAPAAPTDVVTWYGSSGGHIAWRYAGPPVRGFAIVRSPYEMPVMVGAGARSAAVSCGGWECRVVAFNEAGGMISLPAVAGAPARRHGVRR